MRRGGRRVVLGILVPVLTNSVGLKAESKVSEPFLIRCVNTETGAKRLTHDVGELPSIRNHARVHLDKHVDIVLVKLVLEENQTIRFVSREVIADSLTYLGFGGAALHRPITKETKDDVGILR